MTRIPGYPDQTASRRRAGWLRLAVAGSALLWSCAAASAQELNIIALGDWGAPPNKQELFERHTRVAKALGAYVQNAKPPIDAILLLGDNFYGPLTGTDDSRWKKNFVDQFPAATFPMPFYFVLGNHDVEDGNFLNWKYELAYAKLAGGDKRWRFPAEKEGATWYRLDLPEGKDPLATFLCLNSSKDWLGSKKHNPNNDFRWPQQIEWVKAELAKPHAPWLAGVAHYPLYTDGHHYGDDRPGSRDFEPWDGLQRELMPLFVKSNAQFWLAGHDHNLQHLQRKKAKGIDILVSGGGAGDSVYKSKHKETGDFFEIGPGWLHLTFTAQKATGVFQVLDLSKGKGDVNGVDAPRAAGPFERKLN